MLQGNGGKFSHFGQDKYAIDWSMTEGTPVHAARAGKVVLTRDEFSVGKSDPTFKSKANLVFIRHSDGTLGSISISRREAQGPCWRRSAEGHLLALSGNTGYSSQPHLHFMVFRAIDGKSRSRCRSGSSPARDRDWCLRRKKLHCSENQNAVGYVV